MDQSWGRVTVDQVVSLKVGDWASAGSDWEKRQLVSSCWIERRAGGAARRVVQVSREVRARVRAGRLMLSPGWLGWYPPPG